MKELGYDSMQVLSHKGFSLFMLCCSLFTMLPLGFSIREYLDTKSYIQLTITLALCVILILIGRFFYRIAFGIKKKGYPSVMS